MITLLGNRELLLCSSFVCGLCTVRHCMLFLLVGFGLRLWLFLDISTGLQIAATHLYGCWRLSPSCTGLSGPRLIDVKENKNKNYTIIVLGPQHGTYHQLQLSQIKSIKSALENKGCMCRAKRKRVIGHMRSANAQISLRIRTVWPEPSTSTNNNWMYHHRMYKKSNVRRHLARPTY